MWSKSPVDYFCMLMKAKHRDTDRDTAILDEVTQAGWELVLPKVVWNALRHHAWSVEIDRASRHFFGCRHWKLHHLALEVVQLQLYWALRPHQHIDEVREAKHIRLTDSLDRRTLLLFNIRKKSHNSWIQLLVFRNCSHFILLEWHQNARPKVFISMCSMCASKKHFWLTPAILPLFQAERVVGRVRSAVGRSGRPFEEVVNLPEKLFTMALLWLPPSCIPQACGIAKWQCFFGRLDLILLLW